MKIFVSLGWLALQTSPPSLQSMQILVNILSTSKLLPNTFIVDLLEFTLTQNNQAMLKQVLPILSRKIEYRKIGQGKANEMIEQLKIHDDLYNIRFIEKHLLFFSYFHSDELSPIIDRLIHSSSPSSISFSALDTRYILAMIILTGLTSHEKYRNYLQQTWKSLTREVNVNHQQVMIAYAKQWEKIWTNQATMEDIDALVACLNDQYELVGKIMQTMEQEQFEQWLQKTIENIVRLFREDYFEQGLFSFHIENSIEWFGELSTRIRDSSNISTLFIEERKESLSHRYHQYRKRFLSHWSWKFSLSL